MVRRLVITIIVQLLLSICLVAQDTIHANVGTMWCYESVPMFDNDSGYARLLKLIDDNLLQIDTLKKDEVVYVQFDVDTLGFTCCHKVVVSVNDKFDAEALRVCRLIKFDHPAMRNGKPVDYTFTLPVKFDHKHKAISNKKRCRLFQRNTASNGQNRK